MNKLHCGCGVTDSQLTHREERNLVRIISEVKFFLSSWCNGVLLRKWITTTIEKHVLENVNVSKTLVHARRTIHQSLFITSWHQCKNGFGFHCHLHLLFLVANMRLYKFDWLSPKTIDQENWYQIQDSCQESSGQLSHDSYFQTLYLHRYHYKTPSTRVTSLWVLSSNSQSLDFEAIRCLVQRQKQPTHRPEKTCVWIQSQNRRPARALRLML